MGNQICVNQTRVIILVKQFYGLRRYKILRFWQLWDSLYAHAMKIIQILAPTRQTWNPKTQFTCNFYRGENCQGMK